MALSQENRESWRDVIPVLLLIYIPPVGAILMWIISRWSSLTKWIITAVVIMQLGILGYTSFNVYKFVRYQKYFAPVLAVQQALDIYGIQNGKYPSKLTELTPKYIEDIPGDKSIVYTQTEEGKNYSLKATIEGKEVELRPSFSQLPQRD